MSDVAIYKMLETCFFKCRNKKDTSWRYFIEDVVLSFLLNIKLAILILDSKAFYFITKSYLHMRHVMFKIIPTFA